MREDVQVESKKMEEKFDEYKSKISRLEYPLNLKIMSVTGLCA